MASGMERSHRGFAGTCRSSAPGGQRAAGRRRERVRAGDGGQDVDPPRDAPVAPPGRLCVRPRRRRRAWPRRPRRPRRRPRGSGGRGSRRARRRRPPALRTRPVPPGPRRAFRGRRVPEARASRPSETRARSSPEPIRAAHPRGRPPFGVNPWPVLKLGRFRARMSFDRLVEGPYRMQDPGPFLRGSHKGGYGTLDGWHSGRPETPAFSDPPPR